MKTQELIEIGVKLLSDVKDEHKFYSVDGKSLQNIHDLIALLDTIQDEHFYHHVTNDRNDFALWVETCIGDLDLAVKIREANDAESVKKLIEDRLEKVEQALLDYEHQGTLGKEAEKSKKQTGKSKIKVSKEKIAKKSSKSKKKKVKDETIAASHIAESAFTHSDILAEIERAISETKDRAVALEHAVLDNETAIDAMHAASQKQMMGTVERKFYWGDFLIGFIFGTILGIIMTAIYYGFFV